MSSGELFLTLMSFVALFITAVDVVYWHCYEDNESVDPFLVAAYEELDRIDGTKIPEIVNDEIHWVNRPQNA